jgi:hypothetical protein
MDAKLYGTIPTRKMKKSHFPGESLMIYGNTYMIHIMPALRNP